MNRSEKDPNRCGNMGCPNANALQWALKSEALRRAQIEKDRSKLAEMSIFSRLGTRGVRLSNDIAVLKGMAAVLDERYGTNWRELRIECQGPFTRTVANNDGGVCVEKICGVDAARANLHVSGSYPLPEQQDNNPS